MAATYQRTHERAGYRRLPLAAEFQLSGLGVGRLRVERRHMVQRTAQAWLVLTILTHHSESAVSVVTALQFGPQFLFLP